MDKPSFSKKVFGKIYQSTALAHTKTQLHLHVKNWDPEL